MDRSVLSSGLLSSGLGSHWRREVLRTSLWYVPALEVAAAAALFAGTLAADRAAYHGDFTVPGWVISGSADAARQILTTIAAAIITVVGGVFSVILLTLTLASTQFGPRMPRHPADPRYVRGHVRVRGSGARLDRGQLARGLRAAHRRDGNARADGRRPGRAHLLHPPHGGLDPAAPGDREHRRRPGRGDQGAGQREHRGLPEGRPGRGRASGQG